MHAPVYHGLDAKAWEEVAMPVLVDGTDAIVRVDVTIIRGSDLSGGFAPRDFRRVRHEER